MGVETFGTGAYVVVRSDGLQELADKVDEYVQQGYQPFQTLQVIPGVNLRPTEFIQVVVRASE